MTDERRRPKYEGKMKCRGNSHMAPPARKRVKGKKYSGVSAAAMKKHEARYGRRS